MKHVATGIALVLATLVSGRSAFADGYKIDIPGLGSANISQSAAECGEGKGAAAITGQIVLSRGMAMPHYVSVSPMSAAGRAFVQSVRDTMNVPKGASAQQIVEQRTMADYKNEGEAAMQMQDFRSQMKGALVTPDGHFACRRLLPGRYEVMATIYQRTAPKPPYDNLNLKEIMVVRYFGEEVEIPQKSPSGTVRADHFSLLGSAPPGM